MTIPDFILELCRHIGHAPLRVPGTAIVILRPAPGQVTINWEHPIVPEVVETLCVRRSNNDAWTPVTGIVNPGKEPAIAAAREALEEADVRIEVRRPLSVEVAGPVTYYSGDATTYLGVIFATQRVSGESSLTNGESDETTFFRDGQLLPMKDRFRRAVAKASSARPDAGPLTA